MTAPHLIQELYKFAASSSRIDIAFLRFGLVLVLVWIGALKFVK